MKPAIQRLLPISLFSFITISMNPINLSAQCTSSGPHDGTIFLDDNTVGSIAFNSPENAAVSDNNKASAAATVSILIGNSHYLKVSNFGFSIPAPASICGIVVEVQKNSSNTGLTAWITDNSVKLIKGGVITGSNYATASPWPSSESYYTYGGTGDKWGTTWTPADINDPGFGVVFSASVHGIFGLLATANINHIRITIHYLITVLPLSLTSFTAKPAPHHSAHLEWASANDDDEAFFTIQRSSDNTDWSDISIQPAEIASTGKRYSYTDQHFTGNSAFYRLKLEYRGGKIKYSATLKVKGEDRAFNIYPNPASDYLFIEETEKIKYIKCLGMDGHPWPLTCESSAGNIYKAVIGQLPRGFYVLMVNDQQKLFLKN